MLVTYYMGRQCLVASWAIVLFLSSLFAFYTPAIGAEAKDKTELAERKTFIQNAMDEQVERIRENMAEMKKNGKEAIMFVTMIVPFGDWDFYYVKGGSISWWPNEGQKLQKVVVPEGFVTDLASIPRVFWQVLRPEGRYAYAAVVHDYLYWTQTRTREESDQIFKIAMEDSKVDPMIVETVYQAVRRFGKAAWDKNARLKKSGERRILNLKMFPPHLTDRWSEWKKNPDAFEKN